MTDRDDLLFRVAKLSFVDRKKNTQIAAILRPDKVITHTTNISWVQDLIDEAGQWLLQRHERLAELEIQDTPDRQLARDLCDKFGLLDARVVPGGDIHAPFEYAALLKHYARAAADYFNEVTCHAEDAGEHLHVSVSGGQPILDMVSCLLDRKRPNVHFYAAALIGRDRSTRAPHVGSETNATIAWSRSGRIPEQLHYGTVPPYDVPLDELRPITDRTKRHAYGRERVLEEVKTLSEEPYVRAILEDISDNVNIALAGLGIPHASGTDADYGVVHIERLTMTGLLKPFGIEPELLAAEGAVGDLSYILFGDDGKSRPEWGFFLTAGYPDGLGFYRALVSNGKPVIVIAGARKEAAIRPALTHKLFNVLITDSYTAQRLLASN